MRAAFLVLVAWGAAAPFSQAAAPFSHKLHLGLKLECDTCHAAAPASTKVEDNLLPAKSVCLKCHAEAEVPGPITTRVAHFNHSQHLKMGNVAPIIAAAIDKKTYLEPPGDIRRFLDTRNACQACHRGLEESEAVSAANMPRMADCLVCHNQIENPFSCEKCHEKAANLKPANHVGGFLSDHTTGKMNLDKTTCAVCHGRTFRCLGCH